MTPKVLSLGLPVLPESPQQSTDDSSAMDTNDSLHVDITVQDVLPVEENSTLDLTARVIFNKTSPTR